MNYDEGISFSTIPRKTRSRSKIKNVKLNTIFNEPKEWSKDQIYAPKNLRKKKFEIRSNQRDVKNGVILDASGANDFGDANIIIGSRLSSNSDVLTVGTLRPFRCLSASCISDKDLSNEAVKARPSKGADRGKNRKKQVKVKRANPNLSQQSRQRYIQRLRQVVSVGNNKQGQIEMDRCGTDARLQKYQLRSNELIWLELQAWFNDRTLSEQDQVLYNARQCLVSDVLSFVSEFQFTQKYISSLNQLKDKITNTLEQLPSEFACEECGVYVERSTPDEAVGSNSEVILNASIPTLEINYGEKVSALPTSNYINCQQDAISKVGEVMKLLCIIENLYPSSSSLAGEYESYRTMVFQAKVQSLCCWYNITCNLRSQFQSFTSLLDSGTTYRISQDVGPENILLSNTVSSEGFEKVINSYTNRSLKRESVKAMLYKFVKKNFYGLFRAKMILLPIDSYRSNSQQQVDDSRQTGFLDQNKEYLPSSEEESEPPVFSNSCIGGLSVSTRKQQNKELDDILAKIQKILALSTEELFTNIELDFIFDESTSVSPSESDVAIFDLPPIQPLFLFFPKVLLGMMKHCMHLRMKQAMPFFNNSGPSVLTAKQLVVESKEMLQCGLLSRDIIQFFVRNTLGNDAAKDVQSSLCLYGEDLRNMIITYLDFVNTWFVRMLGDFPHAPRGFKDMLEQEWLFAVGIAPSIDFDSVVSCASRFVQISADIVNSTCEFIGSAVNALINSPEEDDLSCMFESSRINDESSNQNSVKKRRQMSEPHSKDSQSPCSPKAQAGLLWFHRQRSASPHLSRQNSLQSEPTTPLLSSTDTSRLSSTSSSSTASNISLPWLQYKCVSPSDYQRRYLFELCRAVRDLFNETYERATRILSFGKILRKTLEPAIGYNLVNQVDLKIRNDNLACGVCKVLGALKSDDYILVDLSDIVIPRDLTKSKPDMCGGKQRSQLDLHKYWLFIPKYITGNGLSSSTRSAHVLQHIKNALYGHLNASNFKTSCCDGSSTKICSIVFVKKPVAMVYSRRRQSEISLHARSELKDDIYANNPSKISKVAHKTHSEINLLDNRTESGEGVCINNCFDKQICSCWHGDTVKISSKEHSKETLRIFTPCCEHFEITHDLTAILACADDVGIYRKELSALISPFSELAVAQMAVVCEIKHSFELLRSTVLLFCRNLMNCINQILNCLDLQSEKILLKKMTKVGSFDMDSHHQIKSEVNEIIQSCFNFGFEYVKEATKIISGKHREKMYKMHLELADQWMNYVLKHRERGKGRRPRWASQGLTFVVSVDYGFLFALTENEFSEWKQKTDRFIDHLIGESSPRRLSSNSSQSESRFPDNLPLPESDIKVLRSLSNSSTDMVRQSEFLTADNLDPHTNGDGAVVEDDEFSPIQRVRHVIADMDADIDRKRMENGIIGRVSEHRVTPIVSLGIRTVNFRWQRGARVGVGAFGRVYTCVNVDTGAVLAMKEVKFQPNDHQKIRSVLDEYTNFEGIKHRNLVQYYGVELHREEMYIFMDYCDGGTLGSICMVNSLPEPMVRRYTSQILAAVHTLHLRGIMHRDIKGSNIFLTSTGIVKLGDFGSAMKLRDISKTAPGEMITHIGTTLPYTAPEVINTSEKIGYGRASDIWSLGCVVIEMASGKQPWHDLERFQVMFRVGSGESPPIPETLTDEGKNFVKLCNIPDPSKRCTAEQLLGHPFVKVPENDEMF